MRADSVRHLVGGSPPGRLLRRGAVRGRLSAERWSLAASHRLAGRPAAPRGGRILAYHSIGTPQWGINDVRPADFERHLQIAADDGWSFATPAEVIANPGQPLLALTFDDGLASVLAGALPVLRHHGIPATAFVVTGWADGNPPPGCSELVLDWRGVRALQDGGWRVQSHSATHRDFGSLSADDIRYELETSRDRLRAMAGVEAREFAIPYGQSANWTPAAHRAAIEAGYATVYAQCVSTRPEGTVPRTFVTKIDRPALFRAALAGAYDGWEEWY